MPGTGAPRVTVAEVVVSNAIGLAPYVGTRDTPNLFVLVTQPLPSVLAALPPALAFTTPSAAQLLPLLLGAAL